MRIPKSPPPWINSLASFSDPNSMLKFFEKLQGPEAQEIVRMANYEYMHWDKFRRYQPLPEGLAHADLWTKIALGRSQQFQTLPLDLVKPRQLRFWMPPRHQEWLHRIDQDAGGLIGSRSKIVPTDDKDRFLYNSLMEEAIASSQLEGATTTRTVAKEMLRLNRRARDRNEQMILNNYRAILRIREMRHDVLTPEMICDIQKTITDKTLNDPSAAGRFRGERDGDVRVVDYSTGDTLHQPPHFSEIDSRLSQLCRFVNLPDRTFIHPVVKGIALHFMMGYIHPFVDGNGRAARALFYWFMLKNGYWLFEFLPISRIVLDAPVSYGNAYLYTETDEQDLTYFTHYNLRIIDRAVQEMHEYFVRQQRLIREAYDEVGSIPGLNHRQIAVAYAALQDTDKAFSVRQHAGLYSITKATARADLFDLVRRGILQKTRDGKKWLFAAAPHIKKRLAKGAFRAIPKTDALSSNGSGTAEEPFLGPPEDGPEVTVPLPNQKTLFDPEPTKVHGLKRPRITP